MLPFNQAFHMNILCLLCMEINISGGRHLQRAVVIPLLHSLRFQRGRAGAGARLLMAQGKATSPIHHQFITIPKKNLNFKLSWSFKLNIKFVISKLTLNFQDPQHVGVPEGEGEHGGAGANGGSVPRRGPHPDAHRGPLGAGERRAAPGHQEITREQTLKDW